MTKRNFGKSIIAAAALVCISTIQAAAFPSSMHVVGRANPPIGHYEFCKTHEAECVPTGGDRGAEVLNNDSWKQLLAINYDVNTEIRPMTDQQIYGVEELWTYPRTVGDCEDYALLKQKMLEQAGFDRSNLLLTVVLQPNGEGHAVLTVRTDRGDFVLDNMRNKVLLWSDTEYTYLKRQASDNPANWVKLQDGRAVAVGSLQKS